MSRTTGSGELPAACFVDGKTALTDYGAPIKTCGNCPHCRGSISQILAFNPTDSYYYLAPCPICGKFIRYFDNAGNLADFAIMKSTKATPLDQDLNVEDRYDY